MLTSPAHAMAAAEDQGSYSGDVDNVKALNTAVGVADRTCSEAECKAAPPAAHTYVWAALPGSTVGEA